MQCQMIEYINNINNINRLFIYHKGIICRNFLNKKKIDKNNLLIQNIQINSN